MRPYDLMMKTMNKAHGFVFRASRGRLLGRGLGMPMLELTTTGRRSGQKRTTMLSSPLQLGENGESIVLVASKGGDDVDPDWFLNLRDDPNVAVTMKGEMRAMTARIADAGERADLWARLTEAHSNYAGYQRKTEREIPVVVLDPKA